MDLIHPHTAGEVADVLRAASADRSRLRVVGGRQHSVPGPPRSTPSSGPRCSTASSPTTRRRCSASSRPGSGSTTCRETLAAGGQEWPVDESGDATVGGVIAADVALPRQLRVGLLRDSVVEMSFATGDGRVIRSGARTVKNVTGYDVHRLLTGSPARSA